VVDDHTVEVEFTNKDGSPTPVTPTLQAIFSQHFTGIVDEEPGEAARDGRRPDRCDLAAQQHGGQRPYVVASRTPGSSIVLKTAPGSWLPAPNYTEVDIRITSGSVASLLQSHAINFGEYGMTNQQVENLSKAGLTVNWRDTGNFDMFAITRPRPTRSARWATRWYARRSPTPCRTTRVLKNIVFGRGSQDPQHRDAHRPRVHTRMVQVQHGPRQGEATVGAGRQPEDRTFRCTTCRVTSTRRTRPS